MVEILSVARFCVLFEIVFVFLTLFWAFHAVHGVLFFYCASVRTLALSNMLTGGCKGLCGRRAFRTLALALIVIVAQMLMKKM